MYNITIQTLKTLCFGGFETFRIFLRSDKYWPCRLNFNMKLSTIIGISRSILTTLAVSLFVFRNFLVSEVWNINIFRLKSRWSQQSTHWETEMVMIMLNLESGCCLTYISFEVISLSWENIDRISERCVTAIKRHQIVINWATAFSKSSFLPVKTRIYLFQRCLVRFSCNSLFIPKSIRIKLSEWFNVWSEVKKMLRLIFCERLNSTAQIIEA